MANNRKVIIIGGGIGGLVSSITLRQHGFDVSLYEKNNEFGGKMSKLKKDGFQFDVGSSILTSPDIISELFEKSKLNINDYIDLVRLNHHTKAFFTDGTTLTLFDQVADLRKYNDIISEDDIRDYEDYLSESKRMFNQSYQNYFEDNADDFKEYRKKKPLLSMFRQRSNFISLQASINKFVRNPKLRELLGASMYENGSSANHTPAIYNVMNYLHHQYGLWYIRGGAHNLTEGLVQLASDIGVSLNNNTEVTAIEQLENEILSIELSTGEHVQADYYISNMSPVTFEQLIDEQNEKTDNYPSVTPSVFIMLLGVSKIYENINYHNIFLPKDMASYDKALFTDKKLPSDLFSIVINTSQLDKNHAIFGTQNLKVVTPVPNLNDTGYTKEDFVYLRHRILSKLEKMGLTDLRANIIFEEIVTPYDIQQKYHSNGGAMNGVTTDMRYNKGFKYPKQSTRFSNVYYVGSSVHPSTTLSMVVLNAQQVGNLIIDEESR